MGAEEREKVKVELNEMLKTIIAEVKPEDGMWNKICTYEEAKEALGGCVPEYIKEDSDVRVVKLIKEDPGCPCGGTHVKHISDIEAVEITKLQVKNKNTRVSYAVKK